MWRTLFCILVTGVWTLVMFCFCIVSMLVTLRASTSLFWVRRGWSPVLVWASGATLEVSGREHVDPARPMVYVSNHQSTIDIPVLFISLPVNLRFVAKAILRYVPLLGWYMTLAKFIFVDRSNHERAVKSLQRAGEMIRGGVSVAVFPEGTRSPDGRVLPFKKGPFALALESRVPVCPVTIEGTGRLMPKNSWSFVPGPIRVKIGAPIDTTPFEGDVDGLIRRVRDEIISMSLEMGGVGGDREDAVAARGQEGIGQGRQKQSA